MACLLSFLSLRPGDTDPDYFESYTERQLEWADARGETLSMHATMLEELSRINWPNPEDVADELRYIFNDDPELVACAEVRLQVLEDGDWHVWWGNPSFDTDHRGYWGASYMPDPDEGMDEKRALRLAEVLIEDAQEMYLQGVA